MTHSSRGGATGSAPPRGGGAEPPEARATVLELSKVGMRFGGTLALSDVGLRLYAGEILAIVGENGAGKSTLMKIATGIYPHGSYQGHVVLDGVEQRFRSVKDAHKSGIVLIPQELLIAPELTIEENMFAGDLPTKWGAIDSHRLHSEALTWLQFFGIHVDPKKPAMVLSPAEQRLAVIAAALSRSARVLVLDEPTASLSDQESQHLFTHLRQLSEMGVPSIFISHRLAEVVALCHRIVVLRNGKQVADVLSSEATIPRLVKAMIGHDIPPAEPRPTVSLDSARVLEVTNLTLGDPLVTTKDRVSDVSFTIGKGEIVGLFGLIGSGRTEIAEALFGTWKGPTAGEIKFEMKRYVPSSPSAAVRAGIGMLTEDRKKTGIFPDHSVNGNLAAAKRQVETGRQARNARSERKAGMALLERLDVRPRNLGTRIEALSGGNQQKVMLGRWLACNPKLLILDEPTTGVDMGAREQIYTSIRALTTEGVSALVISSDVTEILALCDRVIVMRKGRVERTFTSMPEASQLLETARGGHCESR